jgi:IS30 family transposase
MTYTRLDYEKRCKISHLLWTGRYNFSQIAKEIGVNKSTITRELRRNITFERTNLGSWQYKPDYAQTYANERQESKKKYSKFNDEVKLFVNEKLSEQWSPEQISGYAKKHDLFSISHERIYQYILEDKEKGGLLYKNLRHQNKKYRKRYGIPKRTGSIKIELSLMIDHR